MRKADYQHLASLLVRMRTDARLALQHANIEDVQTVATATARHTAAAEIAHDFARGASVDRVEFLKACGID